MAGTVDHAIGFPAVQMYGDDLFAEGVRIAAFPFRLNKKTGRMSRFFRIVPMNRNYTNSMIAVSAASPRRSPSVMMRV